MRTRSAAALAAQLRARADEIAEALLDDDTPNPHTARRLMLRLRYEAALLNARSPRPGTMAAKIADGKARRARLVAAVLAAGGAPRQTGGGRPFWPQIGAQFGIGPDAARRLWFRAVQAGEVPLAPAAD